MINAGDEKNKPDSDDEFWDVSFAPVKRKGPFTDGRYSTEAVEIDDVKTDEDGENVSYIRVPSKLPPAVEITETMNHIRAEKDKRPARVYSDLDAERSIIREALAALDTEKSDVKAQAAETSGEPAKTDDFIPSGGTSLRNIQSPNGGTDERSSSLPRPLNGGITPVSAQPTVKDTAIPSRGEFFDIPKPKFVPNRTAPAFISQPPEQSAAQTERKLAHKETSFAAPSQTTNSSRADEIITFDDPTMPPLEPPPEGFDNSVPQMYMKPQTPSQLQAQSHTDKFNQTYNRSGASAKKTAESAHKPALITEYTPAHSLIRKVSVYRWPSNYSFYEQFCKDAARFFKRTGEACAPVEFFSYIPQYAQLGRNQLDFYLWWRENFRNGVYMQADFSYILLYIYEVINLPDLILPSEGIDILAQVWINYREKYARLDKYLVEWICDYCLIYNLPCPTEQLKPILSVIAEKSTLKEFYISVPLLSGDSTPDESVNPSGIAEAAMRIKPPAQALIGFASNYDWRSSKFVKESYSENHSVFDEHISASIDYLQTRCDEDGKNLIDGKDAQSLRLTRMSRDAFCGSLCAHNIKRRIDIELLSFSRSHEFRGQITDIVKYAENRVRAFLKIKSRLGVGPLPEHVKTALDEYFDRHLPIQRKGMKAKQSETNEYDKYYEAPASTLTLESAGEIEKSSWETTERLITAFTETTVTDEAKDRDIDDGEVTDEYEYIDGEISDTADDEDPETASASTGIRIVDEDEDDFVSEGSPSKAPFTPERLAAVKAALDGRFAEFCRDNGLFAETVAAEINDIAIDLIGDIAIEETDSGFEIIEDYREDVLAWTA